VDALAEPGRHARTRVSTRNRRGFESGSRALSFEPMTIQSHIMIGRLLPVLLAVASFGCGSGPVEHPDPPANEQLTISPSAIRLHPGQSQRFTVVDSNAPGGIVWSVTGGPGTISSDGVYTVPAEAVADTVRFVIEAGAGERIGRARVTIAPGHDLPSCFERDVAQIFRSNCALSGCHDPGGREGGYDFTSYLGVRQGVTPGSPERSRIVLKITNPDEHERMPPAPRMRLGESQIAAIVHWIADGALGDPCPGEAPCDTSTVTYAGSIRGILDEHCVSCHAPGGANNGGIDLTAYEGVEAVATTGQLFGSINHAPGYAPMPSSTDTLSRCEILTIRNWIDKGAPEN
jgi:mono/diheme cytochrome c family protein